MKTILLVDDDPFQQKLVAKQLESLQLRAIVAGSAYEALQLIEKGADLDLILLDCQMPVMDGYALTETIRQIESLRNIPIVAMTATRLQGDARFMESGINDFLTKPFSIQDLASVLARYLRNWGGVDLRLNEKTMHENEVAKVFGNTKLLEQGIVSIEPTNFGQDKTKKMSVERKSAQQSKQDSCVFDVSKLERTFGEEACREIIITFFESNRKIASEILQASEKKEQDKLKFLAHRLSGAAAMACMRDLSRTSAQLEDASSRAEWHEVECLVNILIEQLIQANSAAKVAIYDR